MTFTITEVIFKCDIFFIFFILLKYDSIKNNNVAEEKSEFQHALSNFMLVHSLAD